MARARNWKLSSLFLLIGPVAAEAQSWQKVTSLAALPAAPLALDSCQYDPPAGLGGESLFIRGAALNLEQLCSGRIVRTVSVMKASERKGKRREERAPASRR